MRDDAQMSRIARGRAAEERQRSPAIIQAASAQRGGGGDSIVSLATVIRSLRYADAGDEYGRTEGHASYVCRLSSSAYDAWSSGHAADPGYDVGDQVLSDPEYPDETQDRLYTCTVGDTLKEPGVTEGWESDWDIETEISPTPLEYTAAHATSDLRFWLDWLMEGATVVLVKQGDNYYIPGLDCVGEAGSVSWNQDEGRRMNVYA